MSGPGAPGHGRSTTPVLARLSLALRLAWAADGKALVGGAVVTACLGAYPVAIAWLVKLILDGLVSPQQVDPRWALVALVAVVLVANPLAHGERYFGGELRRGLQLLVQVRLFDAVNRFPGLGPFEQPTFHDRIELAEQAGQSGPAEVVTSTTSTLQAAITVSGFLGSLLVLDPRVALVAVAAGAPSVLAELHVSRGRADLAWRLSPARRRAMKYAMLQSDTQAAKEIRMFGLGDFLLGRMASLVRAANDDERAMDVRELRIQAAMGAVAAVALAVGLWIVVARAMAGGLTVGDVSVALTALFAVQPALSNVASRLGVVHHALLLLDHYQGLVDAAAEHAPRGSAGALPALRQGIELRDVWFRYDDAHPWVLHGVDLRIPRGTTLALVGLNGSGKTTLVKLLCRLYDPARGSVTWDGTPLQDIGHEDLRRRMSVIFQDFMAFDLTAAENIGVGDLDRLGDREAIRAAAGRAGVDGAIAALPAGYDTMLTRLFFREGDDDGQAGVMLSGGQWQRVAVARALLRDRSDLLVLDEPSSGLDAEAEADLYRQVRALRRDRTTLIISHRLGMAREADAVAVLDRGRIVEYGPHDELMRRGGRYAELFSLQAEKYAPTDAVER